MLKNKLLVIVLSGFCFVVLSACAKKEIKNIDSRGKNIICFGDSITFGYGADPGGDYPSALAKITCVPVINAGIDGDTSTEALKRLKSDVLDKEPLMVIVEFGGNDFLRKIPKEITLNNIKAMIDTIQAEGAMVAVVDISTGMLLRQYHSPFYNLAREKGAIFIPSLLKGIITNPRLKSDFIHPNTNGYNVIAQRVYRIITPYLNLNRLLRQSQK